MGKIWAGEENMRGVTDYFINKRYKKKMEANKIMTKGKF